MTGRYSGPSKVSTDATTSDIAAETLRNSLVGEDLINVAELIVEPHQFVLEPGAKGGLLWSVRAAGFFTGSDSRGIDFEASIVRLQLNPPQFGRDYRFDTHVAVRTADGSGLEGVNAASKPVDSLSAAVELIRNALSSGSNK